MTSSIYASLQDDGREFRLLILEPSTDRLTPVRCKLARTSCDDYDVKYTALSYTWGDRVSKTPILVNDVATQVTIDLEAALRHIRKPSSAMVLWVDAICINQEDLAEKSHQVEMMREIYSGAELVIAWLGSASDDSDLAMNVLGKGFEGWKADEGNQYKSTGEQWLDHTGSSKINERQGHNTPDRVDEGDLNDPPAQSAASRLVTTAPGLQLPSPASVTNFGNTSPLNGMNYLFQDEYHTKDQSAFSTGSRLSSNISYAEVYDRQVYWKDFTKAIRGLTSRETLAISKFFKRRWWTRIWVVQEVMLAKEIAFKCGYAEVPGDKMISWGIGPLSILNGHMFYADDELSGLAGPAFNLLEVLRYPMDENNNAIDYLFSFGMRETSRPHDHIYGILGIIPAKDRMLFGATDYGCRAEDLFVNVATKLMVEYNSLELLLAAGMLTTQATVSSTEMDLPSWVPNWTQPYLILKPSKYSRGKIRFFSEPVFHISKDQAKLTVKGLKFDVIESVKILPAKAQGEMPIWKDALTTDERTKDKGGLPPLQRQIAALFLDVTDLQRLDNESGFELTASFFKELKDYGESPGRCEASSDLDNSDYLAGFLHWTGETRDGRADEEILEKVFDVEAARYFTEWYQRQSSADLQRMYMKHTALRNGAFGTAGCSMFRTCKGYFGLTWGAAAAGDILCAVPSCGAPLVLRETQSSVYRLVGPSSSIDGTLHGELPQAAEKGEIAWELFTIV